MIVRGIFLLCQSSLFETILGEEYLDQAIGALEYNPALARKQSYRDFLQHTAVFKEIVPIPDRTAVEQIHRVYRIQYLKDVVLPDILDDQLISTLSSYILFLHVEIIEKLKDDRAFMGDLFRTLRETDADADTTKDRVRLWKEGEGGGLLTRQPTLPTHITLLQATFLRDFVKLAQNLPMQARPSFYMSLYDHGITDLLPAYLVSWSRPGRREREGEGEGLVLAATRFVWPPDPLISLASGTTRRTWPFWAPTLSCRSSASTSGCFARPSSKRSKRLSGEFG